jgi:hypothetical protein
MRQLAVTTIRGSIPVRLGGAMGKAKVNQDVALQLALDLRMMMASYASRYMLLRKCEELIQTLSPTGSTSLSQSVNRQNNVDAHEDAIRSNDGYDWDDTLDDDDSGYKL